MIVTHTIYIHIFSGCRYAGCNGRVLTVCGCAGMRTYGHTGITGINSNTNGNNTNGNNTTTTTTTTTNDNNDNN